MVLQNMTVSNGTSTNRAGDSKDDSKSSNERKYVMMCKSMLDRELLPNDFDIWTMQEQCVWINENIATIFPNVPKSLLDFIPASYYQDCDRSPTDIPEWLDIDKYRRGQKFVRDNYVSLLFSKLFGITLLYSFYHNIKPIIISKRSHTPYLAFKRYISTVQRFFNWYYGEPWIEGTLAYKDMQFARRMHLMIREKLDELDNEQIDNESKIAEPWCQYHELFLKDFAAACPSEKEGQRPYVLINKSPYRPKGMNYEDMAGSQCGLIGLLLLYPQNIGVHNATDDDIEALCHMWKCYGYFLGIKDKYNFCRGSLEEIKQRARDIYQYWVLPNLKDGIPEWEHITRCMIEGINYIPLNYMPYNVVILLAMDTLNISMPHLYASMSWTEWISYKIWRFVLDYALKFSSFRIVFNRVVRNLFDQAMNFSSEKKAELKERSEKQLNIFSVRY